jgi:hypothetical protein
VPVGADGAPTDGAAVTATVTDPDGRQRRVDLTPAGDGVHVGEIDVASAGNYAVGAGLVGPDGTTAIGSDLATLSYAAEYLPGAPNESLLAALSETTGGRGAITPGQAFDGSGLRASPRRVRLAGWLLAIAVGCWLVALVLSRLWIAGSVPVPRVGRPRLGRRRAAPVAVDTAAADGAGIDGRRAAPIDRSPPAPPPDPDAPAPAPSTMDELLRAKRSRD